MGTNDLQNENCWCSFRPVEPFGMQNSHQSGKQRAYRIRNLEKCVAA